MRAEERAENAEARSREQNERQRAEARVEALNEIRVLVHDLARTQDDLLNGDITALGREARRRVRLRQALQAVPERFDSAEVVASGDVGWSNYVLNALEEIDAAVASTRAAVLSGAG